MINFIAVLYGIINNGKQPNCSGTEEGILKQPGFIQTMEYRGVKIELLPNKRAKIFKKEDKISVGKMWSNLNSHIYKVRG